MIDPLAANPIVHAMGWALVHFLWQGALAGAATALALTALRRSAANTRYLVACLGLAVMMTMPIVTAAAFARDFSTAPADAGTAASIANAPAVSPRSPAASATRAGELRWWSRERMERWLPAAVLVWLAGVLALSLHLVTGWLIVERLRRSATRPIGEFWQSRIAAMAAALRLTLPVRVLESTLVAVPMVIGWLRPVILLPTSALAGLSTAQLEAIIAHELAHIRRHDYLVNILQTIVETLLFYHPATWWVSCRIRAEREHCCDDLAVEVCGDRATYARALASLEELRPGDGQLALAATSGPLVERIRRLLGLPAPPNSRSPAWVAACVVLAMLLVAGTGVTSTTTVGAQPPVLKAQNLTEDRYIVAERIKLDMTSADTGVGGALAENTKQADDSAFRWEGDWLVGVDVPSGQTWNLVGGVKLELPSPAATDVAAPQITLAGRVEQTQPAPQVFRPTQQSPQPPTGCAEALSRGVSTAAAQICLGEEQFRLATAAGSDIERRRHWEIAVQHYRKAADVTSDVQTKAAALDALARLHDAEHLNELAQVELVLRELVALLPNELSPLYRLAKAHEDQGLWDAAEDTLLSARRRAPDELEPTSMLRLFYSRRATALIRAKAAESLTISPEQLDQLNKDGAIRVGGGIPPPRRIANVPPIYPTEARDARVQGVVIIEAIVDDSGSVSSPPRILRSIPLLDEAAVDAVRQWRYEPTIVNGKAVPVIMTVTVNFRREEP